jgi:hypothetical protein
VGLQIKEEMVTFPIKTQPAKHKWYEFNRGDTVRVFQGGDEFCPHDRIGEEGVITKIAYDGSDGVGGSRESPYITVTFPDGEHDGFWIEELEKCCASSTS